MAPAFRNAQPHEYQSTRWARPQANAPEGRCGSLLHPHSYRSAATTLLARSRTARAKSSCVRDGAKTLPTRSLRHRARANPSGPGCHIITVTSSFVRRCCDGRQEIATRLLGSATVDGTAIGLLTVTASASFRTSPPKRTRPAADRRLPARTITRSAFSPARHHSPAPRPRSPPKLRRERWGRRTTRQCRRRQCRQ